ncbi:hypothetical protein BV20DRAFT_385620 [Pilatotrama ljubarskyi]|nr:hypothetical protein BV20DRAFT_385620 [Pilatotrama ljubarskyi]
MTGGSSQVPTELAERIIDLCAEGDPPDYRTLLALARVSHVLLPRVLHNLYRHVILHNTGQLDKFLQTVQKHPYLGDWVVQLAISPGRGQYLPLLSLRRCVRHARTLLLNLDLELYPTRYFPAMIGCRQIHHMELRGTHYMHVRRLLRSFPELRTLSLVGLCCRDGRPERMACGVQMSCFPGTLRTLRLEVSVVLVRNSNDP